MFTEKYAKHFDLFNWHKNYKEEIEFLHKWAERPHSVLDVGCGTASYWKYFPAYVKVRGVEKSKAMVEKSHYADHIAIADVKDPLIAINDFECVTALFDVVNYTDSLEWWDHLPLKKGGYFIFDVWDSEKVNQDGFQRTVKEVGDYIRTIFPVAHDSRFVDLKIYLSGPDFDESEIHRMYLWSEKELRHAARHSFEVIEIKKTRTWQTWYKLQKR